MKRIQQVALIACLAAIAFNAQAKDLKKTTAQEDDSKKVTAQAEDSKKTTAHTDNSTKVSAQDDDLLSAKELKKLSVGATYGFNYTGVLALHADYDIQDEANAPVKVRVGWDNYSIGYGAYSESINVFYGGAYYDFGKYLNISKKIHPFWGLGLGTVSVSCSGCNTVSSPSGFYYIGGVQYDYSPKITGEANFNGWGGLSLGANYKF